MDNVPPRAAVDSQQRSSVPKAMFLNAPAAWPMPNENIVRTPSFID